MCKLTSKHQGCRSLTLFLLVSCHTLILSSILYTHPPDGQGTGSRTDSSTGNHNLAVLEPVDVQHGEPVHGAVEHGGGAAVRDLGHGEDVDVEGGRHLQHVLHLVLVHLQIVLEG